MVWPDGQNYLQITMTLHTPVITPGAYYMLWMQFVDEKTTKIQNDKFDFATYYEAYSCSIVNSNLTLNA
jgi:hypothetical protein